MENEEVTAAQTAAGAGSNGNAEETDGQAGTEASRQPQREEPIYTKAEVEALIKARLDEADKRQEKKRADAERAARTDEAKKAGNLSLVLSERETELAQARQELADLQEKIKKTELAGIKVRIAAKHWPTLKPQELDLLAQTLVGDTEPDIESHATALQKTFGSRGAPDNQAGAGRNGQPTDKELLVLEKQAALDSGRYGSY